MVTFAYLKYEKVGPMAIHLVGETIDKTRGHAQAEAGRLVPLKRGIYAEVGDDIEATVLRHAVRIDDTLGQLTKAMHSLALPDLPDHGTEARAIGDQMMAILRARLGAFD